MPKNRSNKASCIERKQSSKTDNATVVILFCALLLPILASCPFTYGDIHFTAGDVEVTCTACSNLHPE